MFKLLLTVFLGVCVGAVVADLLFGPDQPATPSADSTGQQWEPWRTWYRTARDQSRRALAAVVAALIGAARTVDTAARRLARSTAETVRLVPDTARSMRARRHAVAERNAAHARHLAHREAATPQRSPLPPPVAPPLRPGPLVERPLATPPPAAAPSAAGPAVGGPPVGGPPVGRIPVAGQRRRNRPPVAPPIASPARVDPSIPARMRGQEGITTSEMPVTSPRGERPGVADGIEPLGRPPWDALVRRPAAAPAPVPLPDGADGRGRGRGRRRGRRDAVAPTAEVERLPDPEWDEGMPVPLVVPRRVRVRSAAVLLALTGVFGVITATAVLLAVIMAVGALDRL